jgi:hypothetical protein
VLLFRRVASQMDFSPSPEGDASITSRIRNTFEITPTATAGYLLLLPSLLLPSRSKRLAYAIGIRFQEIKRMFSLANPSDAYS